MGTFLTGFLGSVGDNIKQKHATELAQKLSDHDRMWDMYTKIIGSDDFSAEQKQHAAEELDKLHQEAAGGKTGKQKGAIPKLSDMIGKIVQGGGHKKGDQSQPMNEQPPVNVPSGAAPPSQPIPPAASASDVPSKIGQPPIPPGMTPVPPAGVQPLNTSQPAQPVPQGATAIPVPQPPGGMAQNVIPMTPIQRFQGQRPLRDAERQEVLDAEEQGLQTKIANAIKSEEQATGQPLSPDRKQQISATIRKVEPKQGAFTFRTNVNGTDVPPGSRDKYGQPVDPNKRYRVFEDRDGNQELYPEESKKTAAETRIDTAIKNEMSANPRLTREDAERTVRVRERNNAVNDAIAKGLRITSQELQNSATRKRIDKITGELRTGMLSTKNAKIISDGAWRRAKDRQNKDLDAMTRPLRDLYMEELHTMGVDLDELNAALRGSGTLPAGGEADTEAAKAHKRSQQTKPPTVNTPGGAIPQGWH